MWRVNNTKLFLGATALAVALIAAGIGWSTPVRAQEGQIVEEEKAPEQAVEDAAPENVQKLEEVDVIGREEDLVGVANSATEGTVGQRELEARPIQRAGDLLETVPGVVVTQHSGAGKANQYFLRGFNLDHGTDIAITVNEIPVNFPTHGHGQGWIEVNFVIPELVRGIQYKKGPYFADEGDFASAGAVNMTYATELEQGIAEIGYGSFGYRRTLLADSPKLGPGNLLYALEYYHSDGPWVKPDDYLKLNGVLRYALGTAQNTWSVSAMGYSGEWNSTDQIALRAIDQGYISRFGNLDPTDAGESRRYALSTEFERKTGSATTKANAYVLNYRLNLFSNFTYFLDDQVNGDQFEQVDDRITAGLRASHVAYGNVMGRDMDNTIGLQVRHDNISTVGLYKTVARQRLSTTREDSVKESSVALYVQNGTRWTEKFRTIAGLRGDLYLFNVDNKLPTGIDQFNGGSETDSIVSPKLALIFGPWAKTEYYINGGLGFHSNDARGTTISVDPAKFQADPTCPTVTDSNDPAFCGLEKVDPLVSTKGAEVGMRTAVVRNLQSTLSLWVLDIDSELLFIGDAGTTEASRSSRRKGVELTNFYTPRPWLTFDADVAYTSARFTEDAPEGNYIPGAIEGVIAAGVTIDHLGGPFGSLRVRYFGPRALVEDNSVRSDPSTLLNGQIGYRLAKSLKVTVEIFNILNADVDDIEYYYESYIPAVDGAVPTGVPDRHIHPAEPRSFRASLVYNF